MEEDNENPRDRLCKYYDKVQENKIKLICNIIKMQR